MVRNWARGIYPTEAGVELLIRAELVYDGAPWIRADGAVDVDELLRCSGPFSGGERRLVRIAGSLLGGPAVDLSEALPGLDRDNLRLVLAAAAHANGSHDHSDVIVTDGRAAFVGLDAAYPWPGPKA